jgi:hypothetical protein
MLVALAIGAMMAGPSPIRAGEPPLDPIMPIGIPVDGYACDEENSPAAGDDRWPVGVEIVIPLCGPGGDGAAWLDWTPPTGGTAELIGAVDDPILNVPMPSWQYIGASGNVNSGNLEFSLNERAGTILRLVVFGTTCANLPSSASDPCTSGPAVGAGGSVRAIALQPFTLTGAHLAGDLSACGGAPQAHACLIGTLGVMDVPLPFDDVGFGPGRFRGDITWAYVEGITTGCAVDRFCPDDAITRAEMATFLDRMFEPPVTAADAFTDDDASIHEAAIDRIAAAGITTGCAASRFCPDALVSREQMAAFIARAAHLPKFSINPFYDDDFRTLEEEVNRIAAAGIASGCDAYRFCPTVAVTRAQMAAFLHRVVEPIVPPPPSAPCDRSYSPGLCIPPPPPARDCADIGVVNFAVRPPDPHGFDPDHDGIGCEAP